MAIKSFLKMAAFRHIHFVKIRIFNCQDVSEGQCGSCKISRHMVEPLPRYGSVSLLNFFAKWRPSANLDATDAY